MDHSFGMAAPGGVSSTDSPQQPLPQRLVSDLSLSHSVKQALQEAGYATSADILLTSPSDLSTELNITLSQAEDIVRQCGNPPGPSRPSSPREADTRNPAQPRTGPDEHIQSLTAANHLSPSYLPRFSTLSQTVDALISQYTSADLDEEDMENPDHDAGAISPGMAVEISGPPGIGKTSMAVGLALSARMGRKGKRRETSDDGEAGEVLIIDTEGSITPDRLRNAAEAMTRNISTAATSLLDGIHLVRVATQVQMIAFLNLLDDWLRDHPKVNLVIMDSLSYHFRQPNLDLAVRRRIMEVVKQQIGKATMVHHCAVVLVTQLSTKVLSAEGKRVNFDTGEKAVLMPQLGEMWQTAKTLRIALFRGPDGNEVRYAHVGTSSHSDPNGEWACFDINSDGLPMDVEDQTK